MTKPLLEVRFPAAPYPVEQFPNVLREAAESIAERVDAPLAIAANCVLAAAAHIAQPRVNAPHLHKGQGMPCSLYILTLAESGDRKSECERLAFHAVRESERRELERWRQESQTSEQIGSVDAAADVERRSLYGSDASYSRVASNFICGLPFASWATDEGGMFFGGHSLRQETILATIGGLVKLFDEGFCERIRSKGNSDGSGYAFDRRLSISLLAQPVSVRQALMNPLLQGQGFLPRFLFAAAESRAGTRFLTREQLGMSADADPRLISFWEVCNQIMNGTPVKTTSEGEICNLPVLRMTESAEQAWVDAYNKWEGEQASLGEFDGLRPFAARGGELARRVATIFAFFSNAERIDVSHMCAAAQLVDYSLHQWKHYLESPLVDEVTMQADKAIKWLTDADRVREWRAFHRDDWGRLGPRALRPAKVRDQVLAKLVSHGHLITEDCWTYQLHPSLVTHRNSLSAAGDHPNDIEAVMSGPDKQQAGREDRRKPRKLRSRRHESAKSAK